MIPAGGAKLPRSLLVVAAASLAIKLLLVGLLVNMPCSHDQCDYLDLADGILAGRGLEVHDGYLWPPSFIYFLALCRALFGESLTAPRLIQVLASTAAVPCVFLIGERMYDRRAGFAAAALFAFEPTLVAFTHYLWPETLYILFFLVAFHLLIRGSEVSPSDAVLAGLFLGLAALFKGVALYFLPIAAVWILFRGTASRRRRAAICVLLCAATVAPILPWTVRNWIVYDRFLLLDATSGRNLYIGTNLPPPSNWDLGFDERRRVHGGRPRCEDANVVDADRCEVRHALTFIRAHPGLMLRRIPGKLADLLNPSSFLIRHVRLGKYPHAFTPSEAQGVTLVAALAWMAVALLGLVGLVLVPARPGRGLVLALLAYHLGIHAVTFGMTRFRLPLVPFLMLPAGVLLTRPWSSLPGARSPWRLVTAGVGAAVLLGLWAQRWDSVFDVFTLPR